MTHMNTRQTPHGLYSRLALASVLITLLLAPPNSIGTDLASQTDWCGTQAVFEMQTRSHGANAAAESGDCPRNGDCDDPAFRDQYLSNGHVKVVRLFFQVLCRDDGSDPAALASDVAVQVDSLNRDFSHAGFRFEYDMRFVNSTRYRFLASLIDAEQMKSTYAVDPTRQFNIFVTSNSFCLCSYATYPWNPAAMTAQGGIVMTRERFYPQSRAASSLTHEVGHCLGLFHTQHGVTEVPPCSNCYESADVDDGDLTGDFCDDTDPAPSNTTCAPPGGVDQCSGRPWNTTDYHNYMGYAPDQCLSEFTPQQAARMHCWTESHLSSITKTVVPTDTLFGPAPFTVNLAAEFDRSATQWRWDFGDGQTSDEYDGVHTYTRAGVYDVSCTAITDSGVFSVDSLPRVYVTGDTLTVASRFADTNVSARIDISIDNRVPLTRMVIPIDWNGPFGLTFDSLSTAGLRTRQMTVANGGIALLAIQPQLKRMTIAVHPESEQPIPPGSGRVLSLYLHTPSTMIAGENPVRITGYDANVPILGTIPGDYSPHIVNGSLSLGCCDGPTGNVDNDAENSVDISDVSALVLSLFVDLRPLPCAGEANTDGDGDGQVDIADLTRLIDFLFISFTPPADCQ